MNGNFMKQSSVLGKWFGFAKILAQQGGIYVQGATFVLAATGAYTGLLARGVNIPFWAFCVAIGGFIIGVVVFEWKAGLHSTFAAWNDQFWKHENPLRKYLETRDKELDLKLEELRKEIADIRRTSVHSETDTQGVGARAVVSDGSNGPDSSL